jgi:hypothetical protein
MCLTTNHIMSTYGGVEVQHHPFLTLALVGVRDQLHAPAALLQVG